MIFSTTLFMPVRKGSVSDIMKNGVVPLTHIGYTGHEEGVLLFLSLEASERYCVDSYGKGEGETLMVNIKGLPPENFIYNSAAAFENHVIFDGEIESTRIRELQKKAPTSSGTLAFNYDFT